MSLNIPSEKNFISPVEGAQRIFNNIKRGIQLDSAVIAFVVYRSEYYRSELELSLIRLIESFNAKTEIKEINFRDQNTLEDLLQKQETKHRIIKFLYDLTGGDDDLLNQLNYLREKFTENKEFLVFFVSEEDISAIAQKAPDFFRYRTIIIELLQEKRFTIQPEYNISQPLDTIIFKSEQDRRAAIRVRERMLKAISNEEYPDYKIQLLVDLARIYTEGKQREQERAERHLQEALSLSNGANNLTAKNYILNQLGILAQYKGTFHVAVDYFQQALKVAREIGDPSSESNRLGNLGNAYFSLGKADKAIEAFQTALEIARTINDLNAISGHLGNLGNIFLFLGELQRAIESYQQALEIAKRTGDKRSEGNHLGNLGLAYAVLGETQKAIDYYMKGLAISKEIGDRRGIVSTLGNLGSAYRNLGEVNKAIECYQQGLTIAREIGDRQGEGSHLGNLGNAYLTLDEVSKAIESYKQALTIASEIGDRRGQSSRLGNLGIAYSELGDNTTAIKYYQQALAIAEEIGDQRGISSSLGNLSSILYKIGEMDQAINYLNRGLTIADQINDIPNIARHSYMLSQHFHKTDKVQAHQLLCQAYRIWTQMGAPERDKALALMKEWGLSPADCDTIEA